MPIVISGLIGLIIGAAIVFIIRKIQDDNNKKMARSEADRIIGRARNEAIKIEKESKAKAKDFEVKFKKNVEIEIQKQRNKLKQQETQYEKRTKELEDEFKQKNEEQDKFVNSLKEKEARVSLTESRLKDLEKKTDENLNHLKNKLESISSMTQDQARQEMLKAIEDEARRESLQKVISIEEEAKAQAEKNSKKIITQALSRYAGEYTSERTVSVVALPNDEMKGKIIGREGRNIRTLEAMCGVDLIIDDTPEAVVISCFDPVRREVAKKTLEKLMEDGRVHPARIEEVVEKVRAEMAKLVKDEGEKACVDLGINNLHPELVKLVGTLKYRQTHTQNAYVHSMEVAFLSGMMAAEVGANVKLARRAGLLHDIGKAIEHTVEGSHAFIGAEWAKKYGESDIVCHAIRAHHDEEKPDHMIAHIVQAANIMSNSRPGARRPQMDSFIQRLEDLESIGNSFEGVLRTFAVQAGREVRIVVESSRVTDEQTLMLSRDIARKIEREVSHVGQVKVSVVRETRAVEIAR